MIQKKKKYLVPVVTKQNDVNNRTATNSTNYGNIS